MKITFSLLAVISFLTFEFQMKGQSIDFQHVPWGSENYSKELLSTFPVGPRPSPHPYVLSYKIERKFIIGGISYSANVILKSYGFGEGKGRMPLDVYFLKNSKGKLMAIQMETMPWSANSGRYDELLKYLSALYGKPFFKQLKKFDLDGRCVEAKWFEEKFNVILIYLQIPKLGLYPVTVTYIPNKIAVSK